jgi:tetratricopeptide (TPR) repeat protein
VILNIEKTLILTFMLLFLSSLNAKEDNFSQQLASCNQALDDNKPEQAVTLANAILKSNPHQSQAMLCKGRALDALGQTTEAEQLLLASTKESKEFDLVISHLLLGNYYRAHQQLANAINQYDASLALCKQSHNDKYTRISHNLMAATLNEQQAYAEALDHYESGEKLAMNDNERADSYERLAMTYKALNQLDKAIEFQLKGTQMQKKSGSLDQYAEASLTLGDLFLLNKDYPSAEKTLERILKFSQDNGGIYYEAKSNIYLAYVKFAQGNSQSAGALLTKAENMASSLPAPDLIALIKDSRNKNIKK